MQQFLGIKDHCPKFYNPYEHAQIDDNSKNGANPSATSMAKKESNFLSEFTISDRNNTELQAQKMKQNSLNSNLDFIIP